MGDNDDGDKICCIPSLVKFIGILNHLGSLNLYDTTLTMIAGLSPDTLFMNFDFPTFSALTIYNHKFFCDS